MAVETARIEELRRRVTSDPASVAFAALAEEYRRAGRYGDAIATCTSGLERHPAYVSARVTLGRALLETGQFEDARVEFEQVLRLAPENLAAIRALALLHERFEDPALAVVTACTPSDAVPSQAGSAQAAPKPQTTAELNGAGALRGLESFLAAIEETRRERKNPAAEPPA